MLSAGCKLEGHPCPHSSSYASCKANWYTLEACTDLREAFRPEESTAYQTDRFIPLAFLFVLMTEGKSITNKLPNSIQQFQCTCAALSELEIRAQRVKCLSRCDLNATFCAVRPLFTSIADTSYSMALLCPCQSPGMSYLQYLISRE